MIEQNAVRGVHAICFAIIHHDPIGIELGRRVGLIEDKKASFRSAGLPEPCRRARRWTPDRSGSSWSVPEGELLQEPKGAGSIGVSRIFRRLERDLHVALCGEIIDLVRLRFLNNADEVR